MLRCCAASTGLLQLRRAEPTAQALYFVQALSIAQALNQLLKTLKIIKILNYYYINRKK
jgi:hypothetical protein